MVTVGLAATAGSAGRRDGASAPPSYTAAGWNNEADAMWDRILDTVLAEFSDVADVEQITRLLTRLLLAAVLGGVLGYEREHHGKAAGIRTHMLVGMGAALFVLVPQQAGMNLADLSRVIQGIVAGIGFLGAGAIIKNRGEDDVN